MWGALKKDFGEFVTTVATDTAETLAKIDTGLDDGENGNGDGVERASLIDPDTGIPIDTSSDGNNDDDGDADNAPDMSMERPDQLTTEEKKIYLMTCDAVFLDELAVKTEEEDGEATADSTNDVKEFLESFDIETKTEEISTLLEKYPGTLQATFSRLSDQVEYSDFWKRYFFRLSENQIEATYDTYYAIFLEKKEAQSKNDGPSALSNVTNFLGGVVNRLVEENNIDDIDNDDEVVEEGNGVDGNVVGSAASSAMNFLAGVGSGRPPFVLDTAVSDDDDDDDDDKSKEEAKTDPSDDDEEELGWDDDDDDDDDMEDEPIDQEETLEFKDVEKEKLQEELQQAREERDMLHKTVEMQAEEIKKLQVVAKPDIVTGGDEAKQVELLQMQVFEKDSELAALRAQLEDLKEEKEANENTQSNDSQIHDQKADIERLNNVIGELKDQISKLETDARQYTGLEAELEQAKADSSSLQSQLASLQLKTESSSLEQDQATQTLLEQKDADISKLNGEVSAMTQKSNQLAEQNMALKDELNTTKANLATSEGSVDDLRTKLASYEETIAQLRTDLQLANESAKARDSEDSDSTGVKISSAIDGTATVPPAEPSVSDAGLPRQTGIGNDDDGEKDDGWDDDW